MEHSATEVTQQLQVIKAADITVTGLCGPSMWVVHIINKNQIVSDFRANWAFHKKTNISVTNACLIVTNSKMIPQQNVYVTPEGAKNFLEQNFLDPITMVNLTSNC